MVYPLYPESVRHGTRFRDTFEDLHSIYGGKSLEWRANSKAGRL
jgi:hypothetical protein